MVSIDQRSILPSANGSQNRVTHSRTLSYCVALNRDMFVWFLHWILLFHLAVSMQRLIDQRQNLKFLVAEGLSPVQCWNRLAAVYGEEVMSKPTVRRWHIKFREGDGHTPVSDALQSGRPKEQSTPAKIQAVQAAIEEDQRSTLKTIVDKAEISVTTAHRLVKKKLDLRQKVAKFVPRMLTDEQKRMRVRISTENLQRLKDDLNLLDNHDRR